ncbi:GNAT family N-acetyltransferase [Bacteroides sp. 224]|uniref:GNAT family N-acetyltransferase n=1 Tax=Bacteroides sp. 224 TaxID=2302936 RepID=UPI0013D745E1|nr:GNAT family N-acetyltransferase [Bacteroides sp. 224]NDV64332.1 N-acetyltransferase [Bacteroides sp. 224]
MKSYLSNEYVKLRAMEPEDLHLMYKIENNPDLWEVSSFTVPYSRYALKEYIEQSQSDIFADKQLRLMIVRCADNRVVGTIDITDFVPLHARGALGIAILEEFRHKGYARNALELLCEYAFEFLRMKQLYAHVPVDNTSSLNLFLNNGFQQCGVLKEWIQSGNVYKDVFLLQKIRT